MVLKKLKKIWWKLYSAFWLAFVKPSILFESKPPFSDNTRAVYDEMVRRGYGRKYRLVWFLDWDEFAFLENGKAARFNPRKRKTLRQSILHYSCLYKTKCIVCCNTFLPSSGKEKVTYGKNQICFYLTHGSPMKSVKNYYTSHGGVDYMLSPAKIMEEVSSREFSVDISKVFTAGYPRNDVFSQPPVDLSEKLGAGKKKIVVWYPTYRQNVNGTIRTTEYALPIIHDEENAHKLNDTAKANDVLIVLKPHFVQDVSVLRDLNLSNILFISDEFFAEHGLTSYELLAGSDALLTDYSSVYYDYTLKDRPIGVIWEDIEEYRSFPGFAVDLDTFLKGAEKIYQIDELCAFVSRVAANQDVLREERREIRDLVNISTDGKNSQRVTDFIAEKARL